MPTDLSNADETSALVKAALGAYGRVDVLVNNAGYGPPFPLEQLDRPFPRVPPGHPENRDQGRSPERDAFAPEESAGDADVAFGEADEEHLEG